MLVFVQRKHQDESSSINGILLFHPLGADCELKWRRPELAVAVRDLMKFKRRWSLRGLRKAGVRGRTRVVIEHLRYFGGTLRENGTGTKIKT